MPSQEHKPQRKVYSARSPAQACGAPRSGSNSMTGPTPSQLVGPGSSAMSSPQVPATQPSPASQIVPQPPQWLLSSEVSTHAPAQACSSPGHSPAPTQRPPEQTSASSQVTPQPPQLLGSTLVGMHTPSQRFW